MMVIAILGVSSQTAKGGVEHPHPTTWENLTTTVVV
jgi:hypothetical protein